jgi:hypothetical protein
MTAEQVQRARELDCEERGLTLTPQTQIKGSRPNPPYKRKQRKSRIILP